MSIDISKIHYAISINTGTSALNNTDIGLVDGVFRYTTDGYAPTSADTYEDLTPVTGTWYGDMLEQDGIKPSTQSIDIIVGGDFAWAAGLSVDLVNYDALHKKMLTTADLYLVGSQMQMYTIINGVWYSRWKGNVSEYNFSDTTFTFVGKDKNNADNVNLTNYVFGTKPTTTIPIIEDDPDEIVLLSKPIYKFEPITAQNISAYVTKASDPTGPVVAKMLYEYTGAGFSQQYTLNSNTQFYVIEVAGFYPAVRKGMYLGIDNEDELYYIEDAVRGGSAFSTTVITVVGDITKILDTAQLFGEVGTVLPIDVQNDMKKYTEQTLTCSVYDRGIRIAPLVNAQYNVYDNDKLDVYDKDGNLITIRVGINPDGSLTILNKKYAVIQKPSKISYWSDNDTTLKDNIDNGLAKDLQWKIQNYNVDMPQDFDVANPSEYNYFISNTNRYHYFILEFDFKLTGGIPFILANSLANSDEVWSWETFSGQKWNALYDPSLPYIGTNGTSYWTRYFSPHVNTNAKSIDSRFMAFRNTTYRIIEDANWGFVPLVVDEFLLPNSRTASVATPLDTTNSFWTTSTISMNATNLPLSIVKGDNVVSTIDGLRNWGYITDPLFIIYPYGKLDEFENVGSDVTFVNTGVEPKAIKSQGNKIMICMETDNLEGIAIGAKDQTFYSRTTSGDTKKSIDKNNFQFGVNSMGLYTIVEITDINDITIPTNDPTTNTVQKAISDLEGKFVDLPNRTNWFVGGQIIDENKYTAITKLCKQSFLAGITDRFGESQYYEFLEGN